MLLFNNELELIYQNREIPNNLKYYIFKKTKNSFIFRKNLEITGLLKKKIPKLAEIFFKDNALLANINKNIESFKHSNESFIVNHGNPSYEIAVKRNDFQDIDYFLIRLKNQKNIMYFVFLIIF